MKNNKRSPITEKPLRNPGQSLQKQRDNLLYDKMLAPVLAAWLLVVLAGLEWWFYLNPAPRNPVVLSVIALLAVTFAAWRIWRVWPQLKQFNQGIEGEKAVGQFLESLRERGYQVFHDLQGKGFNVDHVIVGPGGVYTIETKTLSKPIGGKAKLQFDGEVVLHYGKPLGRDPVGQAKAQAGWVQKILSDYSGAEFEVWPVVVFPGWFIERQSNQEKIWVLEPKALAKWLANEPLALSEEQVRLVSNSLARFVREQESRTS